MSQNLSLNHAIYERRSIRAFKVGELVSDDQIKLMLEAAMMAPSACNSRPWEFIVVKSRKTLDELADVHPHAKMLKTASLAIIVLALPEVQNDIATGYFPQDCAAASQNILLQAASMGLGTCWCGVYPKEKRIEEVRTVLNLTDKAILPFNIIAVGVPDQNPKARGFYEERKVHII
jgi:nitroreductase